MTFRTAALAVLATCSVLVSAPFASTVQAQTTSDGQWRASPLTLSTLLQDGYRIVAVVSDAHGGGAAADRIFVQRDQSAFKCIDPQPSDPRTKTPGATPACYELVPPSGSAPAAESK